MVPLFEIKHMFLHYRNRTGEEVPVVHDVSFSLQKGEILGIAGESGCGKSTLMWGCMNLCRPPLYFRSGDVLIDGVSLRHADFVTLRRDVYGRKISLIPQGAINSLNPTRKIKHFAVDMIKGHDTKKSKNEVLDLLHHRFDHLGMDPRRVLDAYPFQLSGGMRQRVVIGISTLLDPQLVIADEPTSALDVTTQKTVIDLLLQLIGENIIGSMIFITHELPLLLQVATKTAVMYAGEFVETGKTEQILMEPHHPYSKALMASTGLTDGVPFSLPGTPPHPGELFSGCRFAPRCPSVTDSCRQKPQQLLSSNERTVRCAYV